MAASYPLPSLAIPLAVLSSVCRGYPFDPVGCRRQTLAWLAIGSFGIAPYVLPVVCPVWLPVATCLASCPVLSALSPVPVTTEPISYPQEDRPIHRRNPVLCLLRHGVRSLAFFLLQCTKTPDTARQRNQTEAPLAHCLHTPPPMPLLAPTIARSGPFGLLAYHRPTVATTAHHAAYTARHGGCLTERSDPL